MPSQMKTDVAGRGQYYRDSSSMEVEMQLGNLTASPTPEADIDMDYELNSPRSINDSYDLGSAPQSRSPSPVFEAYDLGSAPQSRSPSPATGEYDLGPIPQFHAPSPGLEYDLGFPPQSRAVSPAFIDIDYDLGSPIHSPSISPGFDGIDPSAILPEYDLGSPLPEGHDGSTFITFENPSETIMNEQALEYLPDRIRVQTQLLYKRRHAISQFREMTADVGQILLRAEALAQSASMDEVEHQIDSNPSFVEVLPSISKLRYVTYEDRKFLDKSGLHCIQFTKPSRNPSNAEEEDSLDKALKLGKIDHEVDRQVDLKGKAVQPHGQ
ncbi:hypothetical protein A0H81_06587 [Grifola frondosa]|uniref:Uncharacterized protein n=1 Tax=Grifola frondosa TaxID=5627 RepID=A0A1C7MAL6_GRIFR|nr:hypothetical protein A0H81_06587 [Grifola frondosa]